MALPAITGFDTSALGELSVGMNRTWAASPEPPDLTTLLEVKKEQPGYFFAERYREHWWEPLKPLVTARFEAQGPDHLNGYRGDPVYVVKEPGSHVAGLLTELFPHFALIFLLRDGRDVVDSWLAAYQDTGQVTGTKDKDYNIIWFTEGSRSSA